MEKRVQTSLLLSIYGPLLTERQRETLRMHEEDDLSLSEIAQEAGVTRQAAHDAIRRGEEQLFTFEEKLGLAARWQRVCEGLREIDRALCAEDIPAAKRLTQDLLREEEAEDGV